MMRKTHLAIALFFILLFFKQVTHPIIFTIVALISTLIPDIDTAYSSIGRFAGSRILQFFTKHRGIIHSLTFCIFISLIFSLFLPILALPFFLGYSIHLLSDSLTLEGIQPFWPSKKRASWFIRTNSNIEKAILLTFILLSCLVFIFKYI